MQISRIKFISLVFSLCFCFLWILSTAEEWAYRGWFHRLKGLGSFFGVAGYLLLAASLFLASRYRRLEDWIGGLDQIYRWHHQLGIWGCIFTFIHPFILAVRWLPNYPNRFLLYIFPVHERLSINLGSVALLLLLALVAVTVFKMIPYDKWKITHKLMSFVFILATLHILLLERRFSSSPLSYMLLFIPMGLGFFGIVYKHIISEFIIKYPLFEVVKTQALNDNIVEIYIKSITKSLSFIPGQYVFCRFESNGVTRESHPFTLCGSPHDPILSILVKVRGDFTRSLYRYLQPGDVVQLEGPYGRFDYMKAGSSQIWIAGGIGIVPFLAWARLFSQNRKQLNRIALFYCIHRKEDAVFAEEFHRISRSFPFFHFFLFCSEKNEHLSVKTIEQLEGRLAEKSILMCGPKRLTQRFTKEFMALGVRRENLIFEDFEFF
jgi:predicted ferric reductase